MRIAIVGGGTRCKRLMDLIERHTFQEINPKVIAVADTDNSAPGWQKAASQGLTVTTDYDDFFNRSDIDLIIELTGSMDVYNDILGKKSKTVRAISTRTAQLFWEISRVSSMHQKTDLELREARVRYNLLINELIQEEVMVIAHDYRILDANETLLKKLGLPKEEVIGRYCYEITYRQQDPCSEEQHPCPLLRTLETEKPSQNTQIRLDRDNNELYYSISTYPMIENGNVIGAIEISRDITKEINVQKIMMQQEKLASVGRLSAGVAHEINNPLTTILTTSMLIQEDIDGDDPHYPELQTIVDETLRCRKIVGSLLDFARRTKPTKKQADLNDILMDSILLTKKQAAFNDVSVIHRCSEQIPSMLLDKGQIHQCLINLILNAIEATPAGGAVVVSSHFYKSSQMAEIEISDNGPGISKENLARIFDPFFTTKDNGTGLGLAISHGFIEQHGGTIRVSSKIGHGTNLKIRLPLNQGEKDGN